MDNLHPTFSGILTGYLDRYEAMVSNQRGPQLVAPVERKAIPFPTRVLELESDAMVPRKVYNELQHCRVTLQAIADELHEADRAPLWDASDRAAAKVRAFDAIASLLEVVGLYAPPQADGDQTPLKFDEDPRDAEDAERIADERLSAMEDAGNRWAEDGGN